MTMNELWKYKRLYYRTRRMIDKLRNALPYIPRRVRSILTSDVWLYVVIAIYISFAAWSIVTILSHKLEDTAKCEVGTE